METDRASHETEGRVDLFHDRVLDRPPRREDPRVRVAALAVFGATVVAVAVVGSRFGPGRAGTRRWYQGLDKPPFQPPPAVFAPEWTVLYGTIAVSGWRVWKSPDQPRRRAALGLWAAQLAANAAWTPTFFGARKPKASLVVLGAQLTTTAAFTIAAARVDRAAAALMGPYLGWTAFAGVLNEEIVRRNPGD